MTSNKTREIDLKKFNYEWKKIKKINMVKQFYC